MAATYHGAARDDARDRKSSSRCSAISATLFQKLLGYLPQAPREMEMEVNNISDPNLLTYFVASTMRLDTADRQAILEERNTEQRLRKLTMLITKELEVVELGHKIQSDIQREMEKNQREFYLRQQLRAIQEELGETDPQQAETNELRKKIDEAEMPEDVKKAADRELDRLARKSRRRVPSTASSARTWIGSCSCRGASRRRDQIDIAKAREILDEDHYDLEKIKDRIVEYLAVGKLKNKLTGPILCFVGPPGVGKTSLGQSIARAMGRKFVRLSVGGVRDEAEIRGHRRTYIGAMPGTIVRALRDAGTQQSRHDDRRDRQGRRATTAAIRSRHCSRSSIRSRTTRSAITTSICRSISRACCSSARPTTLDYDRRAAARSHGDHQPLGLHRAREAPDRQALPRREAAQGQRPDKKLRSQSTIRRSSTIINDYTREAGVRNLEREIGTVFRKIARRIAEEPKHRATVKPENLVDYLGKPRFYNEVKKRVSSVGVATGLFYTPVGGDILFIETSAMPGTGKFTLTGQLGDVMKESATAAVSFLRSRSAELGPAR